MEKQLAQIPVQTDKSLGVVCIYDIQSTHLFIAHHVICRWHAIHPPTHATVWCVGLLPLCAALSLYQEQGSTRPPCWKGAVPGGLPQGRWVSGRLPPTPCFPYTGCPCKAPRAYFPCRHPLEMWDCSAVGSLKRSQYFNKSCFPSSPPKACMKAEARPVFPTTAKQTCQSYGPNPGDDDPLLSWMPSSTCRQVSAVCMQPLHTSSSPGGTSCLLLPGLLALGGLSSTEGLLSLITLGKRMSKRERTICFYLSYKKGRQDCAAEPAVYP